MRQYNINVDELPKKVIIDGEPFAVNYGFRTCMLIEICMFGDLPDEEKIANALHLFYGERIPNNRDEAIKAMLWFYACGPEEDGQDSAKATAPKRAIRRAYCFDQDAPMIYAAFMSQYRIDLNQTLSCELHWWKFVAMFESLDENLLLSRIMYYRTADTRGMGKKQKSHIEKMRALYALKDPESSLDSKTKLARRNAAMKEYVRKRMEGK
ncbi:MAG: hypothetical protein IJ468_14935 [Lachnospiraceae bacterium]|nr:hypothetical protein [Lachnospiraceae bacterium]